MGRPTVMTKVVIKELRKAFLIGATNLEAAIYAGITEKTLYNYIEKHPEFLQQIAFWKADPILKAKQKVVNDINKDTKVAQWYLERRDPEFKPKQETEHSIVPLEQDKQETLAELIISNEQSKQPEPPVEAEIITQDTEQPNPS